MSENIEGGTVDIIPTDDGSIAIVKTDDMWNISINHVAKDFDQMEVFAAKVKNHEDAVVHADHQFFMKNIKDDCPILVDYIREIMPDVAFFLGVNQDKFPTLVKWLHDEEE